MNKFLKIISYGLTGAILTFSIGSFAATSKHTILPHIVPSGICMNPDNAFRMLSGNGLINLFSAHDQDLQATTTLFANPDSKKWVVLIFKDDKSDVCIVSKGTGYSFIEDDDKD